MPNLLGSDTPLTPYSGDVNLDLLTSLEVVQGPVLEGVQGPGAPKHTASSEARAVTVESSIQAHATRRAEGLGWRADFRRRHRC